MSNATGKNKRKRLFEIMCSAGLAMGLLATSYAGISPRIAATPASVQEFFGTNKVKLVYVQKTNNVNTIYYVDFSETSPTIKKLINNTGDVALPVIAPDGNWVVYRDGLGDAQENELCPSPAVAKVMFVKLAAGSTPYQVASTGFSPRFDYKNSSDNQFGVIYPNSFCNGTIVDQKYPHGIGGPKTLRTMVNVSSGTPVIGATTDVWVDGGYNAGYSKDGKYLGAQYPGDNVFILDASNPNNTAISLGNYAAKTPAGKDTLISTNTCNGSMSPSSVVPGAMLMYTGGLGSAKAQTAFGSWGAHQRLIVKTFAKPNDILRAITVPNDLNVCTENTTNPTPNGCNGNGEIYEKVEWWNPEWSNHPLYAVASAQPNRLFKVGTAWNQVQNGQLVYGVNLDNGKLLRLMETIDTTITDSTNMVYPWLWVSTDGYTEPATILTSIRVPIKGIAAAGRYLTLDKNVVRTNTPMNQVVVFNALGAKIWDSGALGAKAMLVSLPAVRQGVYFVKIAIPGADVPSIVKWNVPATR